MEQLLKQLADLEEEKRKTTSEKDDLQQQLLKQKDRMVETEREVGYAPSISRLKIADSKPHWHLSKETQEVRPKERQYNYKNPSAISPPNLNLKKQKSKNYETYHRLNALLISAGQETRSETQGRESEVGQSHCRCRSSSTRRECRTHKETKLNKGIALLCFTNLTIEITS
jgi:hypothetical protein